MNPGMKACNHGGRVFCIPILVAIALSSTPIASAGLRQEEKELPVTQESTVRATGTFEVELEPQGQDEATEIGRMSLAKTFAGHFRGTSTGTMLAIYGEPKTSASYVAMERLVGELNGRSGSFVLVHKGTMSAGQESLTITVAPDTGAGELKGITGTCKIEIKDGQHYYTIEYSLPH